MNIDGVDPATSRRHHCFVRVNPLFLDQFGWWISESVATPFLQTSVHLERVISFCVVRSTAMTAPLHLMLTLAV